MESIELNIQEWLISIGMGDLFDTFEKNLVDEEVLAELTADDLREMGITAVGQRRKLLSVGAA